MKIKKMTASFGRLSGENLELSDGLNVITSPNESGKSTWCAFITAMLYGVDSSQRARSGVMPEKTKYAPWSGAPMEGVMELTSGGRDITLTRRTKTPSAPMRALTAELSGTAAAIPELSGADAGERITGVPRAVFERSAFIRQSGLSVRSSPELEKRIAAIVSTGEEDTSFSETDERLRAWLRKRRFNKYGRLPELEEQIAAGRGRLEGLRDAARERDELGRELEAAEADRAKMRLAVEESRKKARKDALARLGESRGAIRAQEADLEQKRAAAAEARDAKSASVFAGFTPEAAREDANRAAGAARGFAAKASRRMSPAFWIAALALAAVCIALGIVKSAVIATVAGGVLLAAGAVLLALCSRSAKAASAALTELDGLYEKYSACTPEGIADRADEYSALCAALEGAEAAERSAAAALETSRAQQRELDARLLQELDFSAGDSDAARLGRELAETDERVRRLRERCAMAEGKIKTLGDPMVMETELGTMEDERSELTAQYDAIALAVEVLREADAELQSRFSPELARRALELFSRMTGGKYDGLTLDKELDASVRRSGDTVTHGADYLSAGTLDQLYLAIRIAICELATPVDDPCPMVLDDALVNFDEERMAGALELLKELARKRQVILFTCHDRESAYLA